MHTEKYKFGTLSDGTEVTAIKASNDASMSMTIINYGATVQSLTVPAADGTLTDVVLGYDNPEDYERGTAYLGATIGRVGNRIGGAAFTLNGQTYELAKNDGENHLHGGIKGFDKCMWNIYAEGSSVICSRLSSDGEEGYPGNLEVTVTFTLTDDNALQIAYDAESDADTVINLTNHSYFNLNGGGSVLDHILQISADRFCEGDAGCLPTGRLLDVSGTPFDFRQPKAIGRDIEADNEQLRLAGGYDHNYCLNGTHAATLSSAQTGIIMDVFTDRPGMQVYSANMMDPGDPPFKGKASRCKHCAIALETQDYPNSINLGKNSVILKPGEKYNTTTVYKFSK